MLAPHDAVVGNSPRGLCEQLLRRWQRLRKSPQLHITILDGCRGVCRWGGDYGRLGHMGAGTTPAAAMGSRRISHPSRAVRPCGCRHVVMNRVTCQRKCCVARAAGTMAAADDLVSADPVAPVNRPASGRVTATIWRSATRCRPLLILCHLPILERGRRGSKDGTKAVVVGGARRPCSHAEVA